MATDSGAAASASGIGVDEMARQKRNAAHEHGRHARSGRDPAPAGHEFPPRCPWLLRPPVSSPRPGADPSPPRGAARRCRPPGAAARAAASRGGSWSQRISSLIRSTPRIGRAGPAAPPSLVQVPPNGAGGNPEHRRRSRRRRIHRARRAAPPGAAARGAAPAPPRSASRSAARSVVAAGPDRRVANSSRSSDSASGGATRLPEVEPPGHHDAVEPGPEAARRVERLDVGQRGQRMPPAPRPPRPGGGPATGRRRRTPPACNAGPGARTRGIALLDARDRGCLLGVGRRRHRGDPGESSPSPVPTTASVESGVPFLGVQGRVGRRGGPVGRPAGGRRQRLYTARRGPSLGGRHGRMARAPTPGAAGM